MCRTFDPENGLRIQQFEDLYEAGWTFRDLLDVLQSLDEEQLDMEILLYDEEPDLFWPILDFIICKDQFFLKDFGLMSRENQPFFFLHR